MRKNTESMMKGAALGLLAGGAVGAAGAYVAQKNPKEMKKMMKKAGASAERAMETIDRVLNSHCATETFSKNRAAAHAAARCFIMWKFCRKNQTASLHVRFRYGMLRA